MDTNKMREQFEAWECDAPQGPQTDPMWLMYDAESNAYGLDKIQDRWEVWQASREAVVVELPEPESPESYGVTQQDDPEQYEALESRMGAQYSAIFKCKRAIEAQGLKVAP